MTPTVQLIVAPQDAQLRLDRYLVRPLSPTCSRTAIQRAIRDGAVTVDGKTAKAHRALKAGEAVTVCVEQLAAPPPTTTALPEAIPLEILYEDDQLLVVNKPPGLVTHPAPGHWSGTLVNAILGHLHARRQPSAASSGLPRAGIVHRLDKDTSGLLLVAKTPAALYTLSKQLKARTVSRHYLALVEGHVALDDGTINAAIGRHQTHRKQMAVRYLGGRQAVTHYRVLKRCTRDAGSGAFPYSVLEVQLDTGRTHQIRVHLAHLGHPVLGDVVYGRHPASYWKAFGIARQFLHAFRLCFVHPTTQRDLELTARIPDDMIHWLPSVDVEGPMAPPG